MNLEKLCRDSFLRNLGSPAIDAACRWKTLFAKSTPIIVIFVTVAVLSAQWLLTPTFLAHCDAVWGGRQPPHLNGVEPFAYMKATLEALAAGHANSEINLLLPWNFKAPQNAIAA
jgi:hypothetical protein